MASYNARLTLRNEMTPSKQWEVVEGFLKRAEELGPTPELRQEDRAEGEDVIVLFALNEKQKTEFLALFGEPAA